MSDVRAPLRTLAEDDRQGTVFCVALCAASVAHFVPVGERRPWRAVRLALACGVGVQVPRERLWKAATAAEHAGYANASAVAFAAARAARYVTAAAHAVGDATKAATYAAQADSVRGQGQAGHLERLHALVLHQTTPVVPTSADVRRATPGAQVAWDRLAERCPDPVRIGTLGDALARARKARLRWTCPVERALAERCEVDKLIGLWGGRGG